MNDILWLVFVSVVSFISGWGLHGRIGKQQGCTIDNYQECKAAFCQGCELSGRLERAEADLKATKERLDTMRRSRNALSGRNKNLLAEVWRRTE